MLTQLKAYHQRFQLIKTTSKNPRSTVATVTEIYDYIRLLYARVGKPYCPNHHIEIESQTVQQMVDRILELETRTKIQLLAPVISHRKGSHEKLIEDISKKGMFACELTVKLSM